MSLLADPHRETHNSASFEASAVSGCTRLDSLVYQEMRHCSQCGDEQIFMALWEFDGGRVGVCLGCGEQKLVPFSRMNSEAA